MRTKHSIDITTQNDPCCHTTPFAACTSLQMPEENCGPSCPFYKPVGCSDWIRIEDEDGINLIPPEEYRAERGGAWKIGKEPGQEHFIIR